MKLVIEIPKEFEEDFKKDKFKECFGRVQVDLKYFKGETLCGNYEKETLDMLENAFQNATSSETDESVHGKWIDTTPGYKSGCGYNAHVCSNCHDYYTTAPYEMKFCPTCGAKMSICEDVNEAVERLQMLKSEESECPEEKNDDCIIKHLTRECSYNETGCSGCKGKERIKIALEKSEAKKPVDVTRVKDGDNFVGYIGKCPHCGAIVDENDNVSYCDCGQKLAWSEVY